jgi:4-amino-4-deoxy-L-arabinose transferase-like glycosyltransferase
VGEIYLIAALRRFGQEHGLTLSEILDQLHSFGILTDDDIEILKSSLNNFLYSKNQDYVISDGLFQKCVKSLELARMVSGNSSEGSASTPVQKERDLTVEPTEEETVEPAEEKTADQIPRTRFANYSILGALALACFLALVKFTLVTSHQSFGSNDGVMYLLGGALYAGSPSYGNMDGLYMPNYAPGMRVLLSLMFRITGPSILDGWMLSVGLFFVSMIACYMISREIMNSWVAILASVSFGLSPQVFEWAGLILTNVEGVAIAAISYVALLLAIRINKKIFLIAFPLMAIAALTRLTLGAIIVPATIYLLVERKKVIAASRYVTGGVVLSVLTAIIFSFQWFAWPLAHHQSLAILLPTPMGYQSALGQLFYAVDFPQDLALGVYGYILAALFICSLFYIALQVLRGRSSKVRPALYGIIAWFAILFLFYSSAWGSVEDRYSVEFAMPAIILACWFLSVLLDSLWSFVRRQKNLRLAVSGIFMVAMIVCVCYLALLSSEAVLQDVPYSYGLPSWGEKNSGMSEAASWLRQNVAANVGVGSNIWWELFWYAPQYKVYMVYGYSSLESELSQRHIAYLVLCPGWGELETGSDKDFLSLYKNATALSLLDLRPVWSSNTTYAVVGVPDIVIFKVSNQ